MDALEKNIAVARGEALAATVLASAAIQTALLRISNREQGLTKISEYTHDTLNLSGTRGGNGNDEFNTQLLVAAGFQSMQSLAASTLMYDNPPTISSFSHSADSRQRLRYDVA